MQGEVQRPGSTIWSMGLREAWFGVYGFEVYGSRSLRFRDYRFKVFWAVELGVHQPKKKIPAFTATGCAFPGLGARIPTTTQTDAEPWKEPLVDFCPL